MEQITHNHNKDGIVSILPRKTSHLNPSFFRWRNLACLILIQTAYAGVDIITLEQVESRGNARAIGKAGELGSCQLMPSTWKDFSRPGDKWFDKKANRKAATKYLEWIKKELKKSGDKRFDQPSHLLACYNGGITRFRRAGFNIERMPVSTQEYIKRYNKLLRK